MITSTIVIPAASNTKFTVNIHDQPYTPPPGVTLLYIGNSLACYQSADAAVAELRTVARRSGCGEDTVWHITPTTKGWVAHVEA